MRKRRSRLKHVDAKILTQKTANEILHTIESQMADRVHRNWRQELLVPREHEVRVCIALQLWKMYVTLSDSGNGTRALEGIYIVQWVSHAWCLPNIIHLLLP